MTEETKVPSAVPETRTGYWRRILRPLAWWGILVVVLCAIHQHQMAMERTRIYFSMTLYETNVLTDAVAMLDGRPITSGENISLGSHHLTITQPKTESFTTNFFAWYGRHDLGKINLERAMGTLNVTAEPAAKAITISGPEFWLTLSNSSGTNLVVPTDTYDVRAQFARVSDERTVPVTTGSTTPCVFAPKLGAISVTCNETPVAFQLEDANGNFVERGDVPAVVADLPSSRYFVSVTYYDHTLKQGIVVVNEETNDMPFRFSFGAARFESTPPGASVYSANGVYLGTAPVVVAELPPGPADYRLQLNGYDAATISVTVAENETNVASATLVSLSYLGSVQNARQDIEHDDYRNALAALEQALVAKPGDADAINLQTAAKGREAVQEAKELASQGDYIAAEKKLQDALAILPDDAEAKNLQADYKQHEAGQIAKIKQQQTRELFDRVCSQNLDASLFEANEVLARVKSPEEVRNALVRNCETVMPTLKVTINRSAEDGICELHMLQASDNVLVSARRECLMVIGTGKDNQTVVLFKLLEYQRKALNLGDLISPNNNIPNEWVPLHASRVQMTPAFEEQIRVGVRMMMTKISAAVGRETNNF